MHWRDARQLRCPARPWRRGLAGSRHAGMADGRSDGGAYGKGRAAGLPSQERSSGGYAGAACATAEVPPGSRRSNEREDVRSVERHHTPSTEGFDCGYTNVYTYNPEATDMAGAQKKILKWGNRKGDP